MVWMGRATWISNTWHPCRYCLSPEVINFWATLASWEGGSRPSDSKGINQHHHHQSSFSFSILNSTRGNVTVQPPNLAHQHARAFSPLGIREMLLAVGSITARTWVIDTALLLTSVLLGMWWYGLQDGMRWWQMVCLKVRRPLGWMLSMCWPPGRCCASWQLRLLYTTSIINWTYPITFLHLNS